MGGTGLPFKEMAIYAISKATKTRPSKAVTGEMEPAVAGWLFIRNRILAYRQSACTISPSILSPD